MSDDMYLDGCNCQNCKLTRIERELASQRKEIDRLKRSRVK